MWRQGDLFYAWYARHPEKGCWFSCSWCWEKTNVFLFCEGCKIAHNNFWEAILWNTWHHEDTDVEIERVEAIVDEIVKKEWFSIELSGDVFSEIKVKTEKECARIYYKFKWKKRSILINPNIKRKIISKTGGYVSDIDFMTIVSFVNHLCIEKDKYGLTKYKAFQ